MPKQDEKDLVSVLKEYEEAFKESIEATRKSFDVEIRKRRAHYRLLEAQQSLRNATADRLSDLVTFYNN